MPYKKGQSGNPKGRPKGIQDRRNQLRELLGSRSKEIVEKAVEMALEGDPTAMRLVVERLVPALPRREDSVPIPELAKSGSLSEQSEAVTHGTCQPHMDSYFRVNVLFVAPAAVRVGKLTRSGAPSSCSAMMGLMATEAGGKATRG